MFQPFAVSLGAGVKMNGALVISARVETGGCRHLGYNLPDLGLNLICGKRK